MKELAVVTLFLLAAGLACVQEPAPVGASEVKSVSLPTISTSLKDGDGRVATESYCNICHSADYIPMQPRMTQTQWTASVNKMIKAFGAPIDEKTAQEIAQYLATNYGTGK